MAAKEKEMKVLTRKHFFDLLDGGQEEFRIETTTPGNTPRVISEDAPFDRDDPMSYVLVKLIFDEITIHAKGEFSAHDCAEAVNKYGNQPDPLSPQTELNRIREEVKQLRALITNSQTASA